MAISIDEVTRIAKLSRLTFNEQEKQKLQGELSAILDYVSELQKLPATNLNLNEDPSSLNIMRKDVVEETEDTEIFLSQAPDRQGNFIKVKSILE
jgi:aspartyl-tRNA(Asn)/glutamyl-tRNA(Gln) amidotransferase subunit C